MKSDDMRSAAPMAAPTELVRLQAEFFATQYAEMARCLEQAMGLMLEAQKAWVQGSEVWTAQWLRPWAAGPEVPPPTSAHAVFDIVEGGEPGRLLLQAQQAWREIGAAWLDALRHDLGAASGRAA